jgi:hypothetical protein
LQVFMGLPSTEILYVTKINTSGLKLAG